MPRLLHNTAFALVVLLASAASVHVVIASASQWTPAQTTNGSLQQLETGHTACTTVPDIAAPAVDDAELELRPIGAVAGFLLIAMPPGWCSTDSRCRTGWSGTHGSPLYLLAPSHSPPLS